MLSAINFIKGQGGLGTPLPGEDHISGLVNYQFCRSTVFTITFSAALVALNSIAITVNGTVLTQVFTVDNDTTLQALATQIAALKYVASATIPGGGASRVITVTMTGVNNLTVTGALVTLGASQATIVTAGTAIAAGAIVLQKKYLQTADAEADGITKTDANYGAVWYQIKEYFRMKPQGILFLSLVATPAGAYTFTEVSTLQAIAIGKCRQIGVSITASFTGAQVSLLSGIYDALFAAKTPAIILLAADIHAVADLTTLPDLTLLNAPGVGVVIGQDGAGAGGALAAALVRSVAAIGACLGTFSLAKVSENIGWRGKFNLQANDGELSQPAIANGVLCNTLTLQNLSDLQTLGYIFLVKEVGLTGTFWNDAPAAVLPSSDYAHLERTRTIDKAIRGVRAALLPYVNGPVPVNAADGTLRISFINTLEAAADAPLEQMNRDGELSGASVTIDATQNVSTTSKIVITLEQVPNGVARTFEINTQFVTSL